MASCLCATFCNTVHVSNWNFGVQQASVSAQLHRGIRCVLGSYLSCEKGARANPMGTYPVAHQTELGGGMFTHCYPNPKYIIPEMH
jgi:hypothetical protein